MLNLPRSFDGVVANYDSNWYIKRLNNIEIYTKSWGAEEPRKTSHVEPPSPESGFIGDSIGSPHTTPLFQTPSYGPEPKVIITKVKNI